VLGLVDNLGEVGLDVGEGALLHVTNMTYSARWGKRGDGVSSSIMPIHGDSTGDTGAVVELLGSNRRFSKAMRKAAQESDAALAIPAPVLVEVGQSSAPPKKRWQDVLELADVHELQARVAEIAAEGLRALSSRDRCRCGGLLGPTIVDAVVMAFAFDHACTTKEEAIVCTHDLDDIEPVRVVLFTSGCLERV
jgi:hypothetical protein